MKIKVIDLLNKIANGEEVPKKISFEGEIFDFRYFYGNLNYYNENYRCLGEDYAIDKILNNEIEIIEEDKTIEELKTEIVDTERKLIGISGTKYSIRVVDNILINKINELVKEIDKLKENK